MARLNHYGPYISSVVNLAPGKEVHHYLGSFPTDFKGTFVIGAHPAWFSFSRFPQALGVTFAQTVITAEGLHHLNFIVRNSGTTLVDSYTTWVSVIEP